MRIAVYTLTRDRLHFARPCFQRLRERAGAPFDHFVLDNGSADGTPRWLHDHADRFAHVVTSPTNLGIARGCNQLLDLIARRAAEHGPYDLVIKVDDDCELVTPALFSRLTEALERDPDWRRRLVLSPRVLGLLHQPPRARYERLGAHRVGVTGHVGGIFLPVPWALLQGYRFPEDLPLGSGADGHLCRWLAQQGATVGYLEALEVRHHLTTVGQWNVERRYLARKAAERQGPGAAPAPLPLDLRELDLREHDGTAGRQARLPITVVVPLAAARREFFDARCLPSLRESQAERVVVVSGQAGACRKRNAGFARVRTPFVFFCDDDVVLAPGALARLHRALLEHPRAGYAYCSYEGLVAPAARHPLGSRFTHQARPFDPDALRRCNLASTMSLLRTEHFPGFDEGLERLQDWDLWLTLLDREVEGVAVPEVLFTAHYLDQGITASVDGAAARAALALRHDLDATSAQVAARRTARVVAELVGVWHLRRIVVVGAGRLLELALAHAPAPAQVFCLVPGADQLRQAEAAFASKPGADRLTLTPVSDSLPSLLGTHGPFDLLIVEAAAEGGCELSAVAGLAERLSPRAAVLLDHAHDPARREALRSWEEALRGRGHELVVDVFPTEHGLARLQLLGPEQAASPAPREVQLPREPRAREGERARRLLLEAVRADAPQGATVLDLGAGLGQDAGRALADSLGGRVLGVDPAPAGALSLDPASVDVVLALGTLDGMSCDELAHVGREVRRVLRPGGRVHVCSELGREGRLPPAGEDRRDALGRALPWASLTTTHVVAEGDRLLGLLAGQHGEDRPSAAPGPRFTIVLVTHEEPQAAADLLDALDAFTRQPHERVIVDNASSEATRGLLRARLRRGDLLLENQENLRCARASNQALALVRTEYVVYLCARHALVTGPGWDEALLRFMDDHPQLALAGDVWNPYRALQPGRRYRAGWTPAAHGRERLLHVQGGAYVARRRVFEALGAFAADEYPQAGMDVELSYRLISHGYELGRLPAVSCPPAPEEPRPDALVVHPASAALRRDLRERLARPVARSSSSTGAPASRPATPVVAPASASQRSAALVFCERLDNESFCESVVRALGEHLEVRACGPGWPTERLEDLDPTGACLYLELDAASSRFVRPAGLERLRVPKVAWLVDTHKKIEFHRRLARDMDLTLFAMRAWGHVFDTPSAWLPLHADPRHFYPVEAERRWDLVFVGSQPWRAEPLQRIARRHGLSLHVTRTTGRAEKSRTAEIYARARLVFNRHVTNDLNFRTFEATACGRVLLSDAQWNGQYDLFEDGRHLVLYKDERDLERHVLRLLADDALRARIERQAAEHAHAQHTTAARVRQLLGHVEALVGRPLRRAPACSPGAPSPTLPALSHLDEAAPPPPAPLEVNDLAAEATPREATPRRWLVVSSDGEPATVDRRSYAERLAWALARGGHDVLLARARRGPEPRWAGPGAPRVVQLEPGPLRRAVTAEQALLAAAGPQHRQLDRLARAQDPFDAVLVEGPLGQLVGPPLASRLGLPLLLALPTCEVQRRQGRLTRDQLYLAELEHWAADRAQHVLVPWPEVGEALRERYQVRAPALVAWPAAADTPQAPRVLERLTRRLDVRRPYVVLLGRRAARVAGDLAAVSLTEGGAFVDEGGDVRRLGRARLRGRVLAGLLGRARATLAYPWDPARADAEDLSSGPVIVSSADAPDLDALLARAERPGARATRDVGEARDAGGAAAAVEALIAPSLAPAARREDALVLL